MSRTERTAFIDAIFGDGGLASSVDVAVFDSNVERMRAGLLANVPMQLRTYFDNRYNLFCNRNRIYVHVCTV